MSTPTKIQASGVPFVPEGRETKPKFDIYAGTYEDGARLDYMIAVMQRFREVGEAETTGGKLLWVKPKCIVFNWGVANYRIPARHRPKPKTKLVPFDSKTVPVEHWFRIKETGFDYRVLAIGPTGLWLGDASNEQEYDSLLSSWQHSTDRKTWLPCGVEVEDTEESK